MDSKTHKYVSKTAIENININEFNRDKEGLLFYSIQPDLDEREGFFKNHFYNPATRKNFKGERTSALTQYIKYYNLALEDVENGNNYYEHLGRSLHYLVDLNTPVHTYYEDTFDAATRLNQHIKFERHCDNMIDGIERNNICIENIDYYIYNGLKDIGKEGARKASILFKKYDIGVQGIELNEIAVDAIRNCIKSSVGILYRFKEEVKYSGEIKTITI